ncbi:MAG: hypothetical protein ACR2NR_21655 [Solirubrobacteraceae bacterium]
MRTVFAPTAAAIHIGAEGRTGPVAIVLGARFRPEGCAVVAPLIINAIASAPRFYYVDVVNAAQRHAGLRAQL